MTSVSARERELEPGNLRSHRAVVFEVPITWPQAGSRAQRVGQFGTGKLIKRGSKMFDEGFLVDLIGCDSAAADCNFCQFSLLYAPTTLGSDHH